MEENTSGGPPGFEPETGPQGRSKSNEAERPKGERQPPFADKNLAALKIGYRSPRVYGKIAEQLTAALLDSMPVLADYPEEVAALASTEAVVALMRYDLAARGIRDGNGETRLAFLDRYFRAESAAAKRRDALGLSPIGQAVLARERASAAAIASTVDLDALAARGRASLEARTDIVAEVLTEARATYAEERAEAVATWAPPADQSNHDPDTGAEPSTREES
jgi:hypothetical protein